ncbi:UTRA domain-containing protein [Uniformispora flossi]|uniref:UTRA domain-containing protein n=1 Tax=Uniformispora flossi TaxID=3390723 RepID=UPI003C2AF0DF
MLRIPPGEPMFTFDEVHTAEHGRLRETHRTYVPFSILVGTKFEETAPPPAPALFAELEAMGHELHWTEHVRTRMPMPDEAATLRLAEGVPLFQIMRVTYNQNERRLVLEEFKLPGGDLEIIYTVQP